MQRTAGAPGRAAERAFSSGFIVRGRAGGWHVQALCAQLPVVRQADLEACLSLIPRTRCRHAPRSRFGYLDCFRSWLVSKRQALPVNELRRGRLLSGWTPPELLEYLAHVDLRWLDWRFDGRDAAEGDRGIDGGCLPQGPLLTAVGGGARVGGGAGMIPLYAPRCGVEAFGARRDHSCVGGASGAMRVTVPGGDHLVLADHHVFTGCAV